MASMENPQRQGRFTEAQLKAAYTRLKERPGFLRSRNRRATARLQFRRQQIPAKIIPQYGPALEVIMACCDLNPTGICLLHTSFIHTGTEIRVTLNRRPEGQETVAGVVAWCVHIDGKMHAIGLRFEKQIAVKNFLEPEECKELASTHESTGELKGKILFIDDHDMDRMLFSFHLKCTACEVIAARDQRTALAAIRKHAIDVVACDLNIGDMKGEEIVARLRANGFKGRVVAITAETDSARLKAAQVAGVDEILHKPYDGANLLKRIAAWLAARGGEPIHSALASDPSIEPLLQRYVDRVRERIHEIEDGIGANEFNKVRAICVSLRGTGASYGYGLLSAAAEEALAALDSSRSVKKSETELRRLASISRRLDTKAAA